MKNYHLATSITDAGWSGFLTVLDFKATGAGKRVAAVDPAFTSHLCSGWAVVVQKSSSVRRYLCPDCGASLHRNHNAVVNIQGRGQRLRGLAG